MSSFPKYSDWRCCFARARNESADNKLKIVLLVQRTELATRLEATVAERRPESHSLEALLYLAIELGFVRGRAAVSRKVSRRPFCTQKSLDPEVEPSATDPTTTGCNVALANRLEVWTASALPSTVMVFRVRRRNPGSGL